MDKENDYDLEFGLSEIQDNPNYRRLVNVLENAHPDSKEFVEARHEFTALCDKLFIDPQWDYEEIPHDITIPSPDINNVFWNIVINHKRLTDQERKVIIMKSEGMTQKEIAEEIGVSPSRIGDTARKAQRILRLIILSSNALKYYYSEIEKDNQRISIALDDIQKYKEKYPDDKFMQSLPKDRLKQCTNRYIGINVESAISELQDLGLKPPRIELPDKEY